MEINSLIIRKWANIPSKSQEIIKFGLVGLVATFIHYLIYWILMSSISLNIAYFIGYGISFIANFCLTSYFTFNVKPTIRRGLSFGLSHFINYLLQVVLLNIFFYLGINASIAPCPVFLIVIPLNFILVRYLLKK